MYVLDKGNILKHVLFDKSLNIILMI